MEQKEGAVAWVWDGRRNTTAARAQAVRAARDEGVEGMSLRNRSFLTVVGIRGRII